MELHERLTQSGTTLSGVDGGGRTHSPTSRTASISGW